MPAIQLFFLDKADKPFDITFLDVNKTFEKYTGLTPEIVMGERVSKIFPDSLNVNSDWRKSFIQSATNGRIETFEFHHPENKKWPRV